MKPNPVNSPAGSQPLPLWLRIILLAGLLSVAAFSVFGILATFEPNPWWVAWPWRLGYVALCVGSLAGAMKLARRRRPTIR